MQVIPQLANYSAAAERTTHHAATAAAIHPHPAAPPVAKAAFQPAPPIRPTVQDTIDIDQSLIRMHQN